MRLQLSYFAYGTIRTAPEDHICCRWRTRSCWRSSLVRECSCALVVNVLSLRDRVNAGKPSSSYVLSRRATGRQRIATRCTTCCRISLVSMRRRVGFRADGPAEEVADQLR